MIWSALRSGNFRDAVMALALSLPAIVLCMSVHEAAHGCVAYLLGDRTALNSGRVTLSPFAHIDPFGFICLLFLGFGWAKPVVVNTSNFKHPQLDMALVALAGPLSNFITALIVSVIWILLSPQRAKAFVYVCMLFLQIILSMSVGLGVFNLVPVPPLDGAQVLYSVLPLPTLLKMPKYQPAIILILIFALWFGWLNGIMAWVQNGMIELAFRLVGSFL